MSGVSSVSGSTAIVYSLPQSSARTPPVASPSPASGAGNDRDHDGDSDGAGGIDKDA